MFYASQYSAMGTPDVVEGGVSSIHLPSPATGLQLLQPNQITSNVQLLQFVKENNATLNFPQKLMLLLCYVDNERDRGNHITCVSWVPDGHAFVIKNRNELVDNLLPLFFREGKFSSFTRKLYRWGFRQICIPKGGNKKDRDLLFGHEHFRRDNKALISEMKSVTAAGTRRAITAMTNKKNARKNKEKEGNKKPKPALASSPVSAPVSAPALETSTRHHDRVGATASDTKPNSLVQVHLERLLGGPAAKSVATKPETPIQPIQRRSQKSNSQGALDSLLKTKTIPTSKNIKQENLVKMHLERLLGGSNTSTSVRTSPTRDINQDNIVQSHLQRLLGGSHAATTARTSPTTDVNQDNLVQSHLQRLLGGSHTTPEQTNPKAQMPLQTPSPGQNSSQSAYSALLKAKSHSLMPPPIQSQFLGLNDTSALQTQVTYLKAISQSSSRAASPAAPTSSVSFDVGARLQALRQMSAPTKQIGTLPQTNMVAADARMARGTIQSGLPQLRAASTLPKSYLDLIQGSGALVGQPTSISSRGRGPFPNLILPESSTAPRNLAESLSSNMIGGGPSIVHDAVFSKNAQW